MPGLNRQKLNQFIDTFLDFGRTSEDLVFTELVNFEYLYLRSAYYEKGTHDCDFDVIIFHFDLSNFNDFFKIAECTSRFFAYSSRDVFHHYIISWFTHKISIYLN